jgi:transcriptional regulator with XRE-family HTH domain
MTLKKDVAAVIRTARALQGRDSAALAKVCTLTNLSKIENGNINLPLDTLVALAEALDFDAATLLVLCLANHRGEPAEVALEIVQQQLLSFRAQGGHELLRKQFEGTNLVSRPSGKPQNEEQFLAVKLMKEEGNTPSQVIKKLGLPRSTVYDYWKILSSQEESSRGDK